MIEPLIEKINFNNLKESSLVLEEFLNTNSLNLETEKYIIDESSKYGNFFCFHNIDNSQYKTEEIYLLMNERILERLETLNNIDDPILKDLLDEKRLADNIKKNYKNENELFDLFSKIAMVEFVIEGFSE